MNAGVVAQPRRDATPDPMALYAGRFARRCLLEHFCASDHPVLTVERQLLEQARSCLHDFLLSNPHGRSEVEQHIRRLASEKVVAMVEDPAVCKLVLAAIRAKPLDDAFPSVN